MNIFTVTVNAPVGGPEPVFHDHHCWSDQQGGEWQPAAADANVRTLTLPALGNSGGLLYTLGPAPNNYFYVIVGRDVSGTFVHVRGNVPQYTTSQRLHREIYHFKGVRPSRAAANALVAYDARFIQQHGNFIIEVVPTAPVGNNIAVAVNILRMVVLPDIAPPNAPVNPAEVSSVCL